MPKEDSESDSFVCKISNTPLSSTSEFILNLFLHVTILFIFLNGLFNFIIVPIISAAGKSALGDQVDKGIDKAIPEPINFSSSGKYNCDMLNNIYRPIIIEKCISMYGTTPITPVASNTMCDTITNPYAKMICQQQKSNITLSAGMDCNMYVDKILEQNCDQSKNIINGYITSTPLFNSLNISDADDLFSSINSLTKPNTNGNNILDNYIDQYSTPNKLILLHNNNVIDYGFQLSIILVIITVALFASLKYSCDKCINVTKLLLENCITFIFIGGVEFWFFMTYAKDYHPAPPSTLLATAFNTVKSYL